MADEARFLLVYNQGEEQSFFDNNHDDEKGTEEKESRKKFSVSWRSRRKNIKLIFKRLYFMALLSVR
jgi:hypothetical protein